MSKDSENKRGSKRKWSILVFVVGIVILFIGVGIFIAKQNEQPPMEDAEYLVSAGEWMREDANTVIWDFAENGEGKLTTDGHLNNYPFTWTLEDGKLTIITSWLYDLNDEFSYVLDQRGKTLTITNEEKDIKVTFKLQDRPEAKEAEVNIEDGA